MKDLRLTGSLAEIITDGLAISKQDCHLLDRDVHRRVGY
jgi:hypothetical protein